MFVKSKQNPAERYFQGKHNLLSYLYLQRVPISSVFLCARANHRSMIEGTPSYHRQELTFIIAISKVQVPSCTLQAQQSRAECVCVPAGLWPPVYWAGFSARLSSFPTTVRIRMLLAFLWSNKEEIAATPWVGVRTIPCFAALPRHQKHLILHQKYLTAGRAMALELYFGLRLAASVSDLKAVYDKSCLFLPPY